MMNAAQDYFPSKNQKAVQDKFYKSIKDTREPHWRRLYDELRAQHDGVVAAPRARTGTAEDPIEISDGDTVVPPTGTSSETVSETAGADENGVKNSQSTLGDTLDSVGNAMEDIKCTV